MEERQRAAYSEFAVQQWRRLVQAGVVLGLDRHAAEDLAQSTLVRCYVKWARVERADDPAAYAARVLLNLHRSQRRRRWHGERPSEHLPETAVEPEDGMADLHAALAGLSREHREVVLARVHLDLSEKETAALLGVRPETVKSRLSRALARLAADPVLSRTDGGPR